MSCTKGALLLETLKTTSSVLNTTRNGDFNATNKTKTSNNNVAGCLFFACWICAWDFVGQSLKTTTVKNRRSKSLLLCSSRNFLGTRLLSATNLQLLFVFGSGS